MTLEKIHQNPLVVAGFHRSGTSMTMQALVNAGLNPGADLIGATPSNPDGHFEDKAIVDLHKSALTEQCIDWFSVIEKAGPVSRALSNRAAGLIDRRRHQCHETLQPWGFKDPRVCLFMDWWKQLLPDAGYLIVYRDYLSCLHSLRNRQAQALTLNPVKNQDQIFFWENPLSALELWLVYNQALLEFVEANRGRCLIVSHRALLEGFDLIQAVNSILHLSLDESRPTGINSKHQHEFADKPVEFEIPLALKRQLDEVLMRFNALSHSPGCRLPTVNVYQAENSDRDIRCEIRQSLRNLGVAKPSEEKKTSDPQEEGKVVDGPLKVLNPENGDLKQLIAHAKHRIDQEDYVQARVLLEPLHRQMPNNVAVLLHLGRITHCQQQYHEAINIFRQALLVNKDKHALWTGLIRAESAEGLLDDALRSSIQARIHWPESEMLARLQVEILLGLGQAGNALSLCNTFIKGESPDYRFHSLREQALTLLNKPTEAAAAGRKARQLQMVGMADYEVALFAAIGQVNDRAIQQALCSRVQKEFAVFEGSANNKPLQAA